MKVLLQLIHGKRGPHLMRVGRKDIRKDGGGRSALHGVIHVLEAVPQLSRGVAGSPLIPNSINGGEFAYLNPRHKVPGVAIFRSKKDHLALQVAL
jgi:hypothetical protein